MTVIATGYKVDGLPSEDEEEGKKTISEAIEENYPPQVPNQMEDEPVQTIDLSGTLFPVEEQTPRAPREYAGSTSADEVVIAVEDEPQPEETPKQEHRAFGWIRRK